MPIICISCVPFGGGERLGKILAQKLGCDYVSRDDVISRANECGIPVGKLELAATKRPASQERLARLKERYLAVATATICEKAAGENIVYYGRAGHLLLPGVSHVMRVLVLPNRGQRLDTAMQRTRLSKEKAEKFLTELDEDVRNYVRFIHGVDMEDPKKYDFVINLERTNLENAATVLCTMAELPDFKGTPASRKVIGDRLLQSGARMMLAFDDRTSGLDLTVRAGDGTVTITYMPRQAGEARLIPEVLANLPACRGLNCTMASTSILWIQEEFDPASSAFTEVAELARRWGAAVELLRYTPEGGGGIREVAVRAAPVGTPLRRDGGIEDDSAEASSGAVDVRFGEALAALVGEDISGGGQVVTGSRDRVLEAINPSIPYSLVVVGDLFLEKPTAARTRLTREFASFLSRNIKTSVVSLGDIGDRLRIGRRQIVRFAAAAAIVAIIYGVLFLNQDTFLQLLGGDAHKARPWIAPVLIGCLAPFVAALYGSVAGFFLKLFKFD